jgi:hypothetical protein
MGSAANKALVREYLKAFNQRDRETMSDLMADDVVEHGIRDELNGIDRILEFLDAHFNTFPDYMGTTEAIIAEGDMVLSAISPLGRILASIAISNQPVIPSNGLGSQCIVSMIMMKLRKSGLKKTG